MLGWCNDATSKVYLQMCNQMMCIGIILSSDAYLVASEAGDDTDPFFSFFPEPRPFVPPLCFGDLLDFLGDGEFLTVNCSGDAWETEQHRGNLLNLTFKWVDFHHFVDLENTYELKVF